MRIAIIIFCGKKYGGMERRFARLAAFLIASKQDVTLVCTKDFYLTLSNLKINIPYQNIKIIDSVSKAGYFHQKINRLFGLIRALRFITNFEHVHLAMNPGVLTYLYGWFWKILPPYSFSIVDSTYSFDHSKVNLSTSNAKAVDCLSESIRDYAGQLLLNKEDTKKLRVSPCSFTDYSKIEQSDSKGIDILMMSRFTPHKGFDLLESISDRLKGLNIHVCGQGSLEVKIPNAKIYQADNSFLVFARTKIFLSIQEYENYPSQSLLEAMASGCAIIATDVGETRKLLNEKCCVFIKYDAFELLNAIQMLLSNEDKRSLLGLEAKRVVFEEQTVERFSSYFLKQVVQIDEPSDSRL
jgi:glycosyltransferase involved in cell wall biosynthesis